MFYSNDFWKKKHFMDQFLWLKYLFKKNIFYIYISQRINLKNVDDKNTYFLMLQKSLSDWMSRIFFKREATINILCVYEWWRKTTINSSDNCHLFIIIYDDKQNRALGISLIPVLGQIDVRLPPKTPPNMENPSLGKYPPGKFSHPRQFPPRHCSQFLFFIS